MKCNIQFEKTIWDNKEQRKKKEVPWCKFFDVECTESCIFAQIVLKLTEIEKRLEKIKEVSQ